MMDLLNKLLEYVGSSLDKPGRALRGLLGGRPDEAMAFIPFSDTLGLTDPSRSLSGRDLLQQYGLVGENTPGLDAGDALGFLAELVLDPTNLVGAGALAGLAKGGKLARLGKAADALRAAGGIDDDLLKLSKAASEVARPTIGGASGDLASIAERIFAEEGPLGVQRYWTTSPQIAYENAFSRSALEQIPALAPKGAHANVEHARIMSKNPFDLQAQYKGYEAQNIWDTMRQSKPFWPNKPLDTELGRAFQVLVESQDFPFQASLNPVRLPGAEGPMTGSEIVRSVLRLDRDPDRLIKALQKNLFDAMVDRAAGVETWLPFGSTPVRPVNAAAKIAQTPYGLWPLPAALGSYGAIKGVLPRPEPEPVLGE